MEIRSLEAASFSDYMFPGDRVAIVPDQFVAQKERVLAEIVLATLQAGVSPEEISLVLTEKEWNDKSDAIHRTLRRKLPETIRRHGVRLPSLIAHQPGNRREIAHLGAGVRGEPIGLCRAIVDADVVLPVGVRSGKNRNGYYGPFTCVFPRFGDLESQMRFAEAEFRKPTPIQKKKLVAEVEGVAHLLGIVLAVQRIGGEWFCGSPGALDSLSRNRKSNENGAGR